MKKLTLLALGLVASTGMASASGYVPMREPQVINAPAMQVVVDEDFSKFTAGSESAPDAAVVNDEYNAFPDGMLGVAGWIGGGVHQAGGCAALMGYMYNPYPEYGDMYAQKVGGYITTPYTALWGDLTLTFRAKRIAGGLTEEAGKAPQLWVAVCDYDEGPVDAGQYFTLTDQWQTFTFTSSKASFNQCAVQFSAQYTDLLIDDIKLTRKRNTMPAPTEVAVSNLSNTSFRVDWAEVADADHYLVNIYRRELLDHTSQPGTITENFDGMNVTADGKINAANPGTPEGWTINVSAKGSQDVATSDEYRNSAPVSIKFDAEGDEVISPETPCAIQRLSFWVKPDAEDPDDGDYFLSILGVKFYCNGKWEHYANIPYYWMDAEGGYYVIENVAEYAPDATRVQFVMEQKNVANFYIDDVTIDYAPSPAMVPVVENFSTTASSYVCENYDPHFPHYVNITACEGNDIKSAPSEDVWVNGVTDLTPVIDKATATSPTTISASWTEFPSATQYLLKATRITEASAAMNNVTVLHEDFNRISAGSVDSPEAIYSAGAYNLGEEGLADTEWLLTQGQLAPGMAGSRGTSWLGEAGLVASPSLTLSNGGGAFDVTVTANFNPNHAALQGTMNDGIFVLLLRDVTDREALDSKYIEWGQNESGAKTATVHFADISTYPEAPARDNVRIAFMTASGSAFLIDEVTVTQNLKAGETLARPYKTFSFEDNAATFEVAEDTRYELAVQAVAENAGYKYASNLSETVSVDMNAGVEDVTVDDNAIAIEAGKGFITVTANGRVTVYTIDGRTVAAANCDGTPVTIDLAAGIYVVAVDNKACKVAVK